MIRRYLWILSLFLVCISQNIYSQVSEIYPLRFGQYYNYLNLESPAAAIFDSKCNLNIGQQNHLGPFSIVRSLFASANVTLNSKSDNKHNIGVLFFSDKEGELLSFTKAYLQYAYQLKISDKTRISAGAKVGYAKFLAEETATSALISSSTADVGMGVQLQTPKSKFGISLNQAPNSKLKVVLESFTLNRFATMYGSKKKSLAPELEIEITGLVRIIKDFKLNTDFTSLFYIKRFLIVGAGYGTGFGRGLNFHLGLKEFEIFNGHFSTILTYNTPYLTKTLGNIQTIELSVGYIFNSRKANDVEPEPEE